MNPLPSTIPQVPHIPPISKCPKCGEYEIKPCKELDCPLREDEEKERKNA